MDQNHIVPDQLPDEKYIERLFPKCPPKQQQQQGSYYGANDKRPAGLTRSSSARLGNAAGLDGAGTSGVAGNSGQKRRARYKVQQHSRRELEARRNKNKEAASAKDNNNCNSNNTINITNINTNNGHSSDSSDDNNNIGNNRGRNSMRRSNSSNLQQYGGGSNNSAAGNIQKIAISNSSSQATSMSVTSGQTTQTRRSGKYAASQSLLTRQLQRSQSSYNTTPGSNNGGHQVSITEPVALNNASVESSDIVKTATNNPQAVSRGASGIVKSASSFAFLNEPRQQTNISAIRTSTTAAPSSKCQPQVSNLKMAPQKISMAHQDELVESGTGGSSHAYATNTTNEISHLEIASKNDNSPSDLFDDSVDYNTDIAAASMAANSRIRSHRGSNNLSFFESSNTNINPLRQQQPTQNSERNAQELINDAPSVQRNERIKSVSNRTAKMFAEEKIDPVLVDVDSALASGVSVQSSAIPQQQQQPIQTAGLEFHEKIGDNTIRRDPLAATTTAGLINIVGQSQQSSGNSNNINTDKSNCSDNLNGNKTTTNKLDSESSVVSPPNRSKDAKDDKYINLLVYDDNATNHLLVNNQLQSSLEGNRHQLQQNQVSYSNKDTNNRPRGKRYSNRISDRNKENDESNFELQRDNIEITEIVEEEESRSSLVAAVSTTVEFEEQLISPQQQTTLLPSPAPVIANFGSLESENNSFDSQAAPNIISIHHQASQQLLASDFNDSDSGIVRHDASTEELCNTSDSLDETKKCINQSRKNQESDHLSLKSLDTDSTTTTNRSASNTRSHRVPPTIGVLQTVDEKAEINTEELRKEAEEDEEVERVDNCSDKTNLELNSDTMPANQPSFTKKGFVPPGHPQRIRPQTPPTELTNQLQSHISGQPILPTSDSSREVSKPAEIPPENALNPDTDLNSTQDFRSIIKNHTKSENQRVKFDEANLASVRDDSHGRLGQVQQSSLEGDKMHVQEPNSSIIKRASEHPPQMPSISETQFEYEFDVAKADFGSSGGRDLSVGMNKISISNAPQENFGDFSYRNDLSSSEKHNQASRERSLRNNSYVLETQQTQDQQQLPDIQSYTSVDQSKSLGLEIATRVSNLRHHKLPNETSHYSVVRAGGVASGAVCSNINNGDNNINVPSRSSSIQFNTLSDGESGADDESPGPSTTARNYATPLAKKCDQSQQQQIGKSNRNYISTAASLKNNGNAGVLNDDDMVPTTKTALIFPRLDEGLSSEAESCEDEVDDDDEKAMDADVDADDDDDNDNDIDDDLDNDNLSLDKGALQLNQSTVDCFLRQQQQQQSKPQNRLIGSPPQQSSPLVGIMTDQSELHQVKVPGPAYGGYMNQDSLDQNDLKSISGYPNHNGQSNYWMGVSSHQQPNMFSQPSSSQHFSQQTRNQQHNNNPMSKNNNSFAREEAKATNRLSSDTDNETDRLLGSQRNDQLKLTNNDVNSNTSTDLQPVSNVMKQNPNSREVLIEGVLFTVKYLGSTHSDCESKSEKEDRIHQAEMAVHEVKFRNEPADEVQLFISTEKIMVLDDKNRKIKMDHSLRTISYIADIGDAVVLIVRVKNSNNDVTNELGRSVSKISCHVFESSESHTITKSISQAFQVAYNEMRKANGTDDTSSYLPKELDYQEVLNSQEMSTDELEMFARPENQREVIVPKEKGEILGVSIVESGWGSVLPTVVIANLKHDGPAYRCKKISIGDQILSVNGISLVGLPMAKCQEILRKTKNQSVARLSVVPCPITVEVKIKRPDTKYQLGFSVQNGVICSLLRGGIAERGGVRVGHRIMSINGTAVVGVPHDKIVTLLASLVGEIRMKTCLTSLYRLILGEEKAVHF